MRTPARFFALAAALLAHGAAPARADRFGDSLAAAQSNLATPDGRAYADRFAARLDERGLRDALTECAKSASPEDLEPFTVLAEISGSGAPGEVLLRPPTSVAICLRWAIRESAFPRPPTGGWWVSAFVDPRRAPGAPAIPTAGVATATVPPTPTPRPPGAPAAAAASPTPTPTSAPSPTPAAPTPVVPDPGFGTPIHVDPRPDLAALRRRLQESRATAVGPILAQADGVAPDDPRLEPYWSLAEELALPAAIALGPESAGTASPKYRVALSDPLRLEGVLVRHPKLRIVVVGAGWPFGDAMAGLMQRYPQVSADIRPLVDSLPDAEVQAYVRRLADAGLSERIVHPAR